MPIEPAPVIAVAEVVGKGNEIASTDCGRMSKFKTRPQILDPRRKMLESSAAFHSERP